MDLNLVLSTLRNVKTSNEQPQPQRNLLEGSNPRVEWRETRSSYLLNINLQGLSRDDVQLDMDNTRAIIIRGQRYVQNIGIVRWRWRLVEHGCPSSSRRSSRPFRIPEDVNVGAITARFHHGVLHVDMPKLRRTTFTPFQIPIHSCDHGEQDPHRSRSLQEEMVKELRNENMENESVLPHQHGEQDHDMAMIIMVEDQNIPTAPEEPNTMLKDEIRQLPEVYVSPPLSANEIMHPDSEHELPCSYSKEESMQEMEKGHDANPSPSSCLDTSIVSNASEKEGIAVAAAEEQDNLEEENVEGSISDDEDYCAGKEHWRPILCKGLCQLLQCIGVSTACRLKRRRDDHQRQSDL